MKLMVWNVNGIAATKANIDLSAYRCMPGFLSHFGDIACFQVCVTPFHPWPTSVEAMPPCCHAAHVRGRLGLAAHVSG